MPLSVVKLGLVLAALPVAMYAGFLCMLATPFFQTHAVYLHAFQRTGSKDLNVPEVFGFLLGQVTPFYIKSEDKTPLYAWHVLPVELWRRHEDQLVSDSLDSQLDFTIKPDFKLLREDPEALLVIYFHGAGGNVASGQRIPSYRALSAGRPDKVHILTFDYRGFGHSHGSPSEQGLISDAISVTEWAMQHLGFPASRILLFSQSMGTAVNMAVADHYASLSPPVAFAGHILIAPFIDVASLVTTYKIAKTIPVLSPLARYPVLFNVLKGLIRDTWSTKDRLAHYVSRMEDAGLPYRITLLHAQDDFDIPWQHTPVLFWHAVNATRAEGVEQAELEKWKGAERKDLGAAGLVSQWQTEHGMIAEHILKYGLHDVIMGTPVVTLAAMRIFESIESTA